MSRAHLHEIETRRDVRCSRMSGGVVFGESTTRIRLSGDAAFAAELLAWLNERRIEGVPRMESAQYVDLEIMLIEPKVTP